MELTYHFRVKRIAAGVNGRADVTFEAFDPSDAAPINRAGLWLMGVAPVGVVQIHDVYTVVLTVPESWEEIA